MIVREVDESMEKSRRFSAISCAEHDKRDAEAAEARSAKRIATRKYNEEKRKELSEAAATWRDRAEQHRRDGRHEVAAAYEAYATMAEEAIHGKPFLSHL